MGRHLRKDDGTFAGSVGMGKDNIPSAAYGGPAAIVLDFEDTPAYGEVADLDSLYQGWSQRQSHLPPPVEVLSESGFIGLNASVASPQARAMLLQSESSLADSTSERVPPADKAMTRWENLSSSLSAALSELDSAEYALAKRMDAEGLDSIEDVPSGIQAYPVGGVRYSGWRHEDLQSALIDVIAQERGGSTQTRQEVAAVISEYSSYATPTYYKTSVLESCGLSPGDYATPGKDDRRLVLKGLPDDAPGESSVQLGVRAYAHSAEIERSLQQVGTFCDKLPDLDLRQAVVEYSAVRNRVSHLRDMVSGLHELARRQMEINHEDTLHTGNDTKYSLIPGRRVRALDVDRIKPHIITAISRDLNIPRERAEAVVQRFESVAHITSFRTTAVAKKVRVEVDDFLVAKPTRSRLVRQDTEFEGGQHGR